jgi:signal transduction histidine kinase/ligand-binding sensor domain-containing protein
MMKFGLEFILRHSYFILPLLRPGCYPRGVPERATYRVWWGLGAWLALCLAPMLVSGATNSVWFARSWQSDEELPNNTVTGLAQTPDGYLWLGTPSGLVRFDGIRFEDFSPTNFIAPPNRGTIAMLRARSGALWLAMDRGAVVRLESGTSHVFTAGLPSFIPDGLAEEPDGTLWVTYRNGSVYSIKEGQVSPCAPESGLPSGPESCALCVDKRGRLWFAKAGRFGLFRDGSFHTLGEVSGQSARLAAAGEAGVWLCAGGRLFKADDEGRLKDCGDFQAERGDTVPRVLLEDHEGAVWIGTTFSGLFRYDDAGFESIQTTHQEILSLTEDREGNLWVGTAGGGVDRVRRRALALEALDSGLPFAAVQSLCEDANGDLWAATQNGVLARRTGGRWTALLESRHWPSGATCVAADPQGAIWIGTRQHGLYCWRGGRLVPWGDPAPLRGPTLHTLLVSRSGDLWIGQENPSAIQRLREGHLTLFSVPPDSRVIRAMTEDAAGNIWAGTSKGLLFRITGDQVTEVNPRPSKENASIRCLATTPDGALWLGYAGWGVGRLKDGHYAEIGSERGLYDDYISHIVADDHGWLWFAANRGVFKVRRQELEAVAEGRVARVRSIHYGRGEGLPSLQGTFGDAPDVLRSHDGRLWLPMRTALVVADPKRLGDNPQPPPILLKRVSVDDQTVAWYNGVIPTARKAGAVLLDSGETQAELELSPGHRRLDFEFAAPTFAAPESVQFRYRLEGYDEDWVEIGPQRIARFPQLSAGKYRFRVSACNSDGRWNQNEAALTLVVKPFFWQTWWFRSAALAAFTLAIVAIVRYVSFRRLHRQLRLLEAQAALQSERARIAKDIHDDLGANLTQIALLGELAQQDRGEPEKAAARIASISGTARQAIKSLDEIVWAVNPRNDTLTHLIDYTGQFAVDYLRLAGIRCRLDFPEQPPRRELSTEVRHNLFLVTKEALNNIVKHAGATEVWLRAKVTDERLELSIEDNGGGFAQAPDNAWADGLRNMRQRLEEIGGECHIKSQPGSGTMVALFLPWPKT